MKNMRKELKASNEKIDQKYKAMNPQIYSL